MKSKIIQLIGITIAIATIVCYAQCRAVYHRGMQACAVGQKISLCVGEIGVPMEIRKSRVDSTRLLYRWRDRSGMDFTFRNDRKLITQNGIIVRIPVYSDDNHYYELGEFPKPKVPQ